MPAPLYHAGAAAQRRRRFTMSALLRNAGAASQCRRRFTRVYCVICIAHRARFQYITRIRLRAISCHYAQYLMRGIAYYAQYLAHSILRKVN